MLTSTRNANRNMGVIANYFTLLLLLAAAADLPHLLVYAQKASIAAEDTLSNEETLVSSGGVFEVGFFNPVASSFLYLGIWYYNETSPSRPMVWVANRDVPVDSSSCLLRLTADGNLIIADGSGNTVWSTGTSNATKPVLELLDTGNLVVKSTGDARQTALWQSFDHPFNTLLPGMNIGYDFMTKLDKNLTSMKSAVDPSSGDYTYKVNLSGVPEFFTWQTSTPIYRTGPYFAHQFSARPVSNQPSFYKYIFVSNQSGVYLSFQVLNASLMLRIVLNESTGELQRYRRSVSEPGRWLPFAIQTDSCDRYNSCGANGFCIYSLPHCTCLAGFVPKNQVEWNLTDFSGGCVRKRTSSGDHCADGDGFLPVQLVKLPDSSNATISYNVSSDGCSSRCSQNCSCTAYIFDEESGCMTWTGDLIDIRNFSADQGGFTLYYRVAKSEVDSLNPNHSKGKHTAVIIVASIAGFVFLLCVVAIFLCKKHFKGAPGFLEVQELPLYDLDTIKAATRNFSIENKLGQGCFGEVYKGQLNDGQEIAAKKLSRSSLQGTEELKNEALLITQLQHRNLVRLLGCCIEGNERILIYEHLENKSLDTFIFDKRKSASLNWRKRASIIFGIARGLLYLHQDSRLNIIHRDLKPSNILLDKEMNPKISDFGIATIFERDQTENGTRTRSVVGTPGYIAPEYATGGIYSVKSDVFSFGVIVLEILSGRRNSCSQDQSLLDVAWKLWLQGNSLELLDETVKGSYSAAEVLRCIQVGLLCVQEESHDRPTMDEVYRMLVSEGASLPLPKKPSNRDAAGNAVDRDWSSSNEITLTIEGR